MPADPRRTTTTDLDVPAVLRELQDRYSFSDAQLATALGVSLVAFDRWMRGVVRPSQEQARHLEKLIDSPTQKPIRMPTPFPSKGATRYALNYSKPDLFSAKPTIGYSSTPGPPVLTRITTGNFFGSPDCLAELLYRNRIPAATPLNAVAVSASAGKNTYTYDAHTYHTKVPPQGILDFLHSYLPDGGLVLDPFAGSGMTGVAALVAGTDVVLSDLSPAACFIAHNFTETVRPKDFVAALDTVLAPIAKLGRRLYTTTCRKCDSPVEASYYVWSYRVLCDHCDSEFSLWRHATKYGRTVRDHKILTRFPCPHCDRPLVKRTLQRTIAEPVSVAYRCCEPGISRHPLNDSDRATISTLAVDPPIVPGFVPNVAIPDGVNLNQPKRHGLTTIASFYTPRNLTVLSHLWRSIHCLTDSRMAAAMAFVFTSLYQRVSRLAEFRFWGGSGNTARFNVPFVFKEMNVLATFHRKALTILDHLETTVSHYGAHKAVFCGSASELAHLPDESVDLIFTDPPFGANINYSELNLLWEAWLGRNTDVTNEAIINRHQGKRLSEYNHLMTLSLRECHRVLRSDHWLLLVFMNSSAEVWDGLKKAVLEAGFSLERVDVFDKQHGTFKQFVSENTPGGCDVVMHCRKTTRTVTAPTTGQDPHDDIGEFVREYRNAAPTTVYLHVSRAEEIDYRRLYSDWLRQALTNNGELVDFETFRQVAQDMLESREE